ncbi:hypothetical protein KIPB_000241 [Kipferlia bialata]|uniref:Uncharacterized protein n=1 Tax=Kipferlia bialata TaxID=797122 RepID=A0A9K3CLS6_9EUKA|nr:hypothetical protein KIPB_000241 [Kipferlia bialata]|eukprot:g241.t1
MCVYPLSLSLLSLALLSLVHRVPEAYLWLIVSLFLISMGSLRNVNMTMTQDKGKECAKWLLTSWDASLPDAVAVRSAQIDLLSYGKRLHKRLVTLARRDVSPSRHMRVRVFVDKHLLLISTLIGTIIGRG